MKEKWRGLRTECREEVRRSKKEEKNDSIVPVKTERENLFYGEDFLCFCLRSKYRNHYFDSTVKNTDVP